MHQSTQDTIHYVKRPSQRSRLVSRRTALTLLLGLSCLGLIAQPALALPPPDPQALALTALEAAATQPVRIRFEHGFPVAIRANVTLSGADAEARARSVLTSFPDLFRQGDVKLDLRLRGVVSEDADEVVSFSQTYAGLPVFDSVLTIVNSEPISITEPWTLGMALGQLMVDDVVPLDLDVIPAVSAANAEDAARAFLSRPGASTLGESELGIINPDVHDISGSPHLAYRVTLGGGAPHQLYVDAHTLAVDFEHTLVEDAYPDFDLDLEDANWNNIVDTSCFWDTTDDDQIGDEDGVDPDSQDDSDAVAAYYGIKHIVDWYYDVFGRRSWDNDDDQIEAYVHSNFETAFPNARYAHACGVEFTNGMVGGDITAHEFSHGVIRYSLSDLIYKNQSGALNESYADTMASFADPDDDWLLGEDTVNGQGAIRSLFDPPGPWCRMGNQNCGDPDKWSDYVFTTSDKGGVHTNSGIPNKAHFLISEGGPHNGLTITGIGNAKARRLIYFPMRFLPPSADMELAASVTAGIAEKWAESGKYSFNAADACQVRNAWAAVELIDSVDLNCDGVPDSIDDADGDRIVAADDNCPNTSNPGQFDSDNDGIGNACDTDTDGDGWPDSIDNCPNDYQPGDLNTDLDGDGDGNGCDDDDDGDGVLDGPDNCQWTPNADQADTCGSPLGDACDFDIDIDGDTVCGSTDNCPFVYNPGNLFPNIQADADGDGIGDACDACMNVADDTGAYTPGIPELGVDPAPYQPDSDGDGTPDACDTLGFGGAGLLVGGNPYNPANPLAPGAFFNALDITGSAGDVIEVTLPVCPDTGRLSPGPDDRVELVFTGLENAVDVSILDESGAAITSSFGPVPAGRGLRFRPDCIHTYRLRLRLGAGFSGSDSASLDIDNTVAVASNPWTETPGLGFPPPSPPADSDGDGIIDAIDSCPLIVDPMNMDTDLDGNGNVCDTDDDNDGLPDTVETGTHIFVDANDTGSSPLLADSDGDGIDDGTEVAAGSDPNDPFSTPAVLPLLGWWGITALIATLAALGGLRRGHAEVT